MSKSADIFRDLGRDFSDFPDLPQMEDRDHGWTGLGVGSPKTRFLMKKTHVFGIILAISHYMGVPPGPPIGLNWPQCGGPY